MTGTIYFLTGNKGKLAIAKDVFSKYGLGLEQADLDVPEIQSLNVSEVACASTEFASKHLNGVIIKSDVGYYFDALQGFPGPLIKWINQTLSASDLIALMQGKTNRRVILRECLACRMDTGEVHLFEHSYAAHVVHSPVGVGSAANQVLIIDGFDKTIGQCSPEELHQFWIKNLDVYHQAAKFLSSRNPILKLGEV